MRRTKIIATIGPAIEAPEMLEAMMQAGVAVFRLNMSHAKHDWVRATTANIRAISQKLGIPVGIMMDTQGPEIRTGEVAGQLDLKAGEVSPSPSAASSARRKNPSISTTTTWSRTSISAMWC